MEEWMLTANRFTLGAILLFTLLVLFVPIGKGQNSPQMSDAEKQKLEEIEGLIKQAYKLTEEEKYDEALPIAEKALVIAVKNFKPNHFSIGIASYYLALVSDNRNDLVRAEELYKRSLSIAEELGDDDEYVAQPAHALADLYFRQDALDKAEPLYLRALSIWEKLRGPDHRTVLAATIRLGSIYRKTGAYTKAEQYIQRSIAIEERTLGPDHIDVAKSLSTLAEIYIKKSEFERADIIIERAEAIVEKRLDSKDPHRTGVLVIAASRYTEQGEYDRAISLYRRAIELTQKAGKPQYPDTSDLIYALAELFEKKKDYEQAEQLYQQLIKSAEKTLGPNHADVASLLKPLARMYASNRDYEHAKTLYQRALMILEKTHGLEDIQVGQLLADIGWMYFNKGDYDNSEPLFLRSLAIAEKALKPSDPFIAASRSSLALLYTRKKNYERAEALFLSAIAIAEKYLGPENVSLALYFVNIGNLYMETGNSVKAESFLTRSVELREKFQGPTHVDVAMSLDSLGYFYLVQTDYGKAEAVFKRALTIRENSLGRGHPYVATSLDYLGSIYASIGDYEKAELMYQRVLTINEQSFGKTDLAVAYSLNNLAGVYLDKADYKAAEPLLRRSLKITENVRGSDDPHVGFVLNLMALLYKAQGDFSKAEPIYLRALKIHEKAYGSEDTSVAADLHNLALLFTAQENFAKAEPLFLRSLAIEEKAKGASHPSLADTLLSISYFYGATGDMQQAIKMLTRGTDISERTIANILATATGTEEQKRAYMAMDTISYETKGTVSLHMQFAPNDSQAARLALTTILRRKGRVLDAVSDSMEVLRRSLGPEERKLLEQLSEARSHFATVVLNGPGTTSPSQFQSDLSKAEAEAQRLEAMVSARSAESRVEFQPVTIEKIQALIPEDAVLVEIVSYQPFNPKYRKDTEMWGRTRYAVYALRSEGPPMSIDLGDAALIDSDITKFRAALRDPKHSDVKQVGRLLDEKVMRPVRKLIGDTKKILLSPDGDLNLIPFGALVDEQGRYLVENYLFTYLTSGRDLLRMQVRAESTQGPVVFADPLYDSKIVLGNLSTQGNENTVSRAFDFSNARFPPLPGTAEEAKALREILPNVKVLTGAQATKIALKLMNGPSILHIATHGFFLPDQQLEPMTRRGATRGLGIGGDDSSILKTARIENPLLRSGLAFAGANQRQNGGVDNGILTALETAGLDLRGTKLVVLSACETGVGEVKVGDGVYGLRRALVIAGSESQVISLWQVSDAATRDLMVGYYKRLQAGQGRAEAMRQVQLEMLQSPQRSHPFYWAAFIQSGDWRKINDNEPSKN